MNKYSEYFDIDEGYWPEINPSSIKDPSNKWDKTFPHNTFIDLLKATERMLARGTNSDKKGIWIEGAYGTGKSRVAWTLLNLLNCPDETLGAYFDEYPTLRAEPDLRDKLLGHKQGKIITAYRYASGGIDSDRALIMAVYESITRALRDAGVPYNGENTLRGGAALWLADSANEAFFNTLIALPEYRGLGSFAGKSTSDIINLLKNPNANVDALMGDILTLADKRGITALTISMDDLIAWLTDIIDKNELKAIVLVWDEFTAYFKRNRTSLDEFQKLAELANLKPFYLMIVTHMSGSIFSETDQAGKIVRDRFVRKEIELPDSIAFELIKHALKVKDNQQDIWDTLAAELNDRVKFARKSVADYVKVPETVLEGILPLHPLSALLLKNISSAFASNQRSMFNFIKNAETENLQAFQWLIDTHSPDAGDILSIDYLWNFFYEKGTDEYGTGVGRGNLDAIIRTILDVYPKNESKLNNEQKRVLKTVLMMQAISQKQGDSVELFLPTEQNINYAFEGTDFEQNRAVNIIKNQLIKDGILYAKPMGNGRVQYAAAAVSGDQAQINDIKQRITNETKTMLLVTNGELVTALSLTAALRFRFEVTPVTIENFTVTINRITNESKTYKMRLVLSFARNDEEQNKIRELIRGAMKDDRYGELVFVDTSSSVLGGERFEQWVECAANEEYWRAKDRRLADEMSRKAKNFLEDWKTDIAGSSLTVYSEFAKTGEPYGSASQTLNALANLVMRKYPFSFDNAKVSDNFFLVSGLPSGAKFGITQTCGGVFQQASVLPLMQGVWQVDNYWESVPNLPLAKLKLMVDELVRAGFESGERRLAIGDVFEALLEKGFMPCNLYALLTGFLLKEYAADTYRYSDGETGDKMNVEKLSEIIGEYIKHKNTPIPRYKEKYIAIMSKEQRAFTDFVRNIFGIPDNLSVEQTAVHVRAKIKNLGYPIWCFKGIDDHGLVDFIDKLVAIANPSNSGVSVAKIADVIGQMSLQAPEAAKNLAELLTRDNAEQAIRKFLAEFENGEILDLAEKINAQDMLGDVRRQVGSGEALWLWDQETGEDELRKLFTDYKIVFASNQLGAKTSSLQACLGEWREKTKSIRIPYSALLSELPELKIFLGCLHDIVNTGDLPYDKRKPFLAELEGNTVILQSFFQQKAEVFQNMYASYLTGFSETEVKSLYAKLPTNSFSANKSEFERIISEETEKIRGEQVKYQLHQLWEGKTASKTPRDWSAKNKTPLLSLVPIALRDDAKRAFGAINKNNPEDTEVKFAFAFLQDKVFLDDLSDKVKVDAAFVRDIIGRFFAILPDVNEVRRRLETAVSVSPYDWYGDPVVQSEIEKFAKSRYNQGGSDKVLKKIDGMDADKAKEYLKRLIKDNINVGIEIISEEGGSEV